jgi:hypothetical protein
MSSPDLAFESVTFANDTSDEDWEVTAVQHEKEDVRDAEVAAALIRALARPADEVERRCVERVLLAANALPQDLSGNGAVRALAAELGVDARVHGTKVLALVVRVGGGRELAVEPYLKAQFEMCRPSPAYERVLREVPDAFVGSFVRLRTLVLAASAQMRRAFRRAGLSAPPWREPDAVLEKWRGAFPSFGV